MGFQEQLNIIVTADASGALQVFRSLPSAAQGEMAKVESVAGGAGNKAGTAFGANFSEGAKTAFTALQALVAGFGTVQLVSFAKSSISDAVEYARVNASLDAAIQGVGASAGVTKDGIEKLSASIQAQDAIWKGDTKAAATLLLTMQEIQNQSGPGNQIFNRALQVTAAISNTGRDIQTVALQLGRALENPASGLQGLSRSGIPLSVELKAQVLELAKRGDTIGAQKLLLDDLEKRYLEIGAAAAKADPLQQFSVSLKEFKTAVGNDLKPVAEAVLGSLTTMMKGFEELPAPVRDTTEALAAFAIAATAVSKIAAIGTTIGAAVSNAAAPAPAATQTVANAAATESTTSATVATAGYAAATNAAAQATNELGIAIAATGGETTGLAEVLTSMGLQSANTATQIDALGLALDSLAGSGASLTELTIALAGLEGVTEADIVALTELITTLAALDAQAGATTPAIVSMSTAMSFLGAAIGGIALGSLVGGKINEAFAGSHEPVNRLADSLEDLGKTGTISGSALKEVGADAKDLAGDIETINGSTLQKGFGLAPSAHEAKASLKDVNDALIQLLNTKGTNAAELALGELTKQLEAQGRTATEIGSALDPFITQLSDAEAHENAMAGAAKDANSILASQAGVFADLTVGFDIKDAVDSVTKAIDQYKKDKADIAGTSQKAKDAAKAEADAQHGLEDAIRGVDRAHRSAQDAIQGLADAQYSAAQSTQQLTDAQRNLQEAQQALDEFNSARGQRERALQEDIIHRRFVTDPSGEDQKQLDLLRFQDENRQKQQELNDRVRSAQEGVASATHAVEAAYRGVTKAQQAVKDAEQGIEDATYRVARAQDAVTAAHQRRLAVAADARARLQADYDAEQTALAKVIQKLQDAASQGDINATQTANWVEQLQGVANKMNGPVSDAVKNLSKQLSELTAPGSLAATQAFFPNIGNYSLSQYNRLALDAQLGPSDPSIPPNERALLHRAGIPGFDWGGVVPGLRGTPTLAIVHGGERVLTPDQQRRMGGGITIEQHNHFSADTPSMADLDYANRSLGWALSQAGRY